MKPDLHSVLVPDPVLHSVLVLDPHPVPHPDPVLHPDPVPHPVPHSVPHLDTDAELCSTSSRFGMRKKF
jgi:hypothetical protein